MDGITPPCQTAEGCWLPPLGASAARALELRDKLVRLHRLEIGAEIMRIYRTTAEDLELLAICEDELNPREEQDGPGFDMDTEC